MGLVSLQDFEEADPGDGAPTAQPLLEFARPPIASLPASTAPAVRTAAAEPSRLISPRPAPPAAAGANAAPAPRTRKPTAAKAATAPAEIRVRVIFDGGSKGNPGQGYGSYALLWPGQPKPEIVRLTFDGRMTNNEAEYDTLIAALQDLIGRAQAAGGAPAQVFVEVWGDSQLVVNQVNGAWKINKAPLQVRCNQARALLQQFGFAAVNYHPREQSVAVLGH